MFTYPVGFMGGGNKTHPVTPIIFNTPTTGTTWTVPGGVTIVTVEAWGGGAGGDYGNNLTPSATGFYSAAGAYINFTMNVTPGQVYTIYVAGGGLGSALNVGTLVTGGTNGGGNGAYFSPILGNYDVGCGGGGWSGISLSAVYIGIAAGAGGSNAFSPGAALNATLGGPGGGLIGAAGGSSGMCGQGGTQLAGGIGGVVSSGPTSRVAGVAGSSLQGGSNPIGGLVGQMSGMGGGGGGGYYGGGSGSSYNTANITGGSGGGGSSYINGTFAFSSVMQPGVSYMAGGNTSPNWQGNAGNGAFVSSTGSGARLTGNDGLVVLS